MFIINQQVLLTVHIWHVYILYIVMYTYLFILYKILSCFVFVHVCILLHTDIVNELKEKTKFKHKQFIYGDKYLASNNKDHLENLNLKNCQMFNEILCM